MFSERNRQGVEYEYLTELSDSAAASFGSHCGFLDISGVFELSDSAAEALSKHQGEICWEDPRAWVEGILAEQTDGRSEEDGDDGITVT